MGTHGKQTKKESPHNLEGKKLAHLSLLIACMQFLNPKWFFAIFNQGKLK
jgi:hypothetical protein